MHLPYRETAILLPFHAFETFLSQTRQSHREIMMLLSMVHSREIQEGKREGRGDTSQAQNWSNFRNARIDKVRKQVPCSSGPGFTSVYESSSVNAGGVDGARASRLPKEDRNVSCFSGGHRPDARAAFDKFIGRSLHNLM